jgi:DNA-directed RNA polymerase specialized sigma24 family protein
MGQIAVRDGGRAGWEEFIQSYGHELRRRISRELWKVGEEARHEKVEELAQEAYCRMLAGGTRPHGVRNSEVLTYLDRLAVSVVVDHLRQEGAAKRGRDVRKEMAGHEDFVFEKTPLRSPDPEQILLLRERRRLFLSRCCRHVGQRARRRTLWILTLAFFGDWRSHEIAGALGGRLSASTIDSMVHRVKHHLKPADRELLRG